MFRTHEPDVDQLDDLLDDLPRPYRVVHAGDGRVVIGPTGAFVLAEGAGNVPAAGALVANVAENCRAVFAVRLIWAPFVDALVVAERAVDHPASASVVPARMVHETLTHGPRLLADDQVERMADILADLSAELATVRH